MPKLVIKNLHVKVEEKENIKKASIWKLMPTNDTL